MPIKTLSIYHFGDPGPMDINNPIHNMTPSLEGALYDLTQGKRVEENMLKRLEELHMVKDHKLTFPFFLREDVAAIVGFRQVHGRQLADKILANKQAYHDLLEAGEFSKERRLYHLLGCDVLDGDLLTYLAQARIITLSKVQPNGRDYLLIGFEDHESVLGISDRLLCSCNHMKTATMSFISFGDSNGRRMDFYRQLRDGAYEAILAQAEDNIRNYLKTGQWLDNQSRQYLEDFGYVKDGHLAVPVFKDQDKEGVMVLTQSLIGEDLKSILKAFKDMPLKALDHGVPIDDIANELYHQIFGQINEYLMADGFYEEAEHIEGEGRYHRALIMR